MAPRLIVAALVLLPMTGLAASSGIPLAQGIERASGSRAATTGRGSRAATTARAPATRSRAKARSAAGKRRSPTPAAAPAMSRALTPAAVAPLGAWLHLTDADVHARIFGEREVDGLVQAAEDLYAGAVIRDGLGVWLWARPSPQRVTLSPFLGDNHYGLYLTGCFR